MRDRTVVRTVVVTRAVSRAVGIVGKSAYQSYLDTTTDDPPMTEDEWAAGGGTGTVDAAAIAAITHAATEKATPVDADEIGLADSAASFGWKKLTWAGIKTTLKGYFDTLYQAAGVSWTTLAGKPATFPPTIGTTGTTAVAGNDARLADARTPTEHTQAISSITGVPLVPTPGLPLAANVGTVTVSGTLGGAYTVEYPAVPELAVASFDAASGIGSWAATDSGYTWTLSLVPGNYWRLQVTDGVHSDEWYRSDLSRDPSGSYDPGSGDTTGNPLVTAKVSLDVKRVVGAIIESPTLVGPFTFPSGSDAAIRDALNVPASDPTDIAGADAITNIVSLTAAEYAALGTKNSTTLYIVT
jgi:hypothetical protein